MRRADKLERLVSLARLQLRLSEWQFAHLQQQDASLQDEQAWLVGALNRGESPLGSSSETLARRLARTSMDAREVQAQASQQLDQVRAGNRRVKQLQEVAKVALAEKLREAEKRSLEELNATNPAERDPARRPSGGDRT
jgi:choline dehydrogenase-like flavoprotein